MENFEHDLTNLFKQLGLPNSEQEIDQFCASHGPIADHIKLEQAACWNAAQAELLREAINEDSVWSDAVDQLNVRLRKNQNGKLTMQTNSETVAQFQRKAVFHGAAVILVGMFAGFALMVAVLGEISFWPFFSIPVNFTSDPGLWRAAHTGPVINGLMCILLALSLNLFPANDKDARTICNYLVYMVWGNTVFYIARLWGTENRGLAFGTEQFGSANVFDVIAMIPAALAVYWGIFAVIKLLILARKNLK